MTKMLKTAPQAPDSEQNLVTHYYYQDYTKHYIDFYGIIVEMSDWDLPIEYSYSSILLIFGHMSFGFD